MKSLRRLITERLILSKHRKLTSVQLSVWVRWYSTPVGDDIIDDSEVNTELIISALTGNSNKRLNGRQLVNFYHKYKNDYIEDFKEVKAPIKDYPNAADISFKIGGLKFDYNLTVSFEDFIKQYNEQ